jgi:uncharacterized membrane protein
MELTILLSKVFGIYLIIAGLACLVRQNWFMSIVHNFVEEKLMRVIVSAAELIAGLFLIFNHNVWSSFSTGLVSLFGWMMAVEGATYLFLPDRSFRKLIGFFNKKGWYSFFGLVAIVLGIYLTRISFGF